MSIDSIWRLQTAMNQKLDKIISLLEEQNKVLPPSFDFKTVQELMGGMGDIVGNIGDVDSAQVAIQKMKTILTEKIDRQREQLKSEKPDTEPEEDGQ